MKTILQGIAAFLSNDPAIVFAFPYLHKCLRTIKMLASGDKPEFVFFKIYHFDTPYKCIICLLRRGSSDEVMHLSASHALNQPRLHTVTA